MMDPEHSCSFLSSSSNNSFVGRGSNPKWFSLKSLWNVTCQIIRQFAVETVNLYNTDPSSAACSSSKSLFRPVSEENSFKSSALLRTSYHSTHAQLTEWSNNRSVSLTISHHFTVLCAFRAETIGSILYQENFGPLVDQGLSRKLGNNTSHDHFENSRTDLNPHCFDRSGSSGLCSENDTSEDCSLSVVEELEMPEEITEGLNNLQMLKLIGKGSFGKVVLARNRNCEEQPTAVKIIQKPRSDAECQSVLVEIRLLTLAGADTCPFLAKMYTAFSNKDRLFLCMEYCNGGDLMYHIQKSRRFTEDQSRFYAAEVLCAISFLHRNGIMYRDVKLDNVLLDWEGHCKLTDFGMAKDGLTPSHQVMDDDEQLTYTFCGTPDYVAPELIQEKGYNYSVDWWGFGILLYQMLLGQTPYETEDEDELFHEILFGTISYPKWMGSNALSVLRGLLTKTPSDRLGCRQAYGKEDEIRQHPFFRSIDWPATEARKTRPPFQPRTASVFDTKYFDKEFTDQSVAEMSFMISSVANNNNNNSSLLPIRNASYQKFISSVDCFSSDFDYSDRKIFHETSV